MTAVARICLAALLSSTAFAKDVTLKWRSIEGAKEYNLEVSTTGDFVKKVLTKTVSTNSLQRDLSSGVYFLRVNAVDKLGRASSWSKPFKLVVTAPIKGDDAKEPEKVSYASKAPQVTTNWRAQDSATQFKVTVEKDGKPVITEETTNPQIKFAPKEPGHYAIKVSAGMNSYYGPAVTVKHIDVEKKELEKPEWDISKNARFSDRRSVRLDWKSVPGATSYQVRVHPVEGRGLASIDSNVTEGTKYEIEHLDVGRYVASVEAKDDGGASTLSNEYVFDVKKGKPVEFEKIDLSVRLGLDFVKYSASVVEAGNSIGQDTHVGSSAMVKGTLWFPGSNWGINAAGTWGGYSVLNNPVAYNDLELSGTHRFSFQHRGLRSEIKPFLGARVWTTPIVVFSQNNYLVLTPTSIGPLLGADACYALSRSVAFHGRMAVSSSVANSNFGTGTLSSITFDGEPRPQIELGVKVALNDDVRLLALYDGRFDTSRWSASGNGPNGSPVSGNDQVDQSINSFVVGIEATDSGNGFRADSSAETKPGAFTDVDLQLGYVFKPTMYNSTEQVSGSSSATHIRNSMSGAFQVDTTGWLRDSHQGGRFSGGWGGLSVQGTTISYPEFYLQWGLRDSPLRDPGWGVRNFFGLRAWQVPIVESVGDSSNTLLVSRSPQVIGPAETFQLFRRFSRSWLASLTAEISTPVLPVSKDAVIDQVSWKAPSALAECRVNHSFNDDLAAGAGVGYKYDQLKYQQSGQGEGNPSRVEILSPTISLFGTYSF